MSCPNGKGPDFRRPELDRDRELGELPCVREWYPELVRTLVGVVPLEGGWGSLEGGRD